MIAGVDLSTRAVDIVAIDENHPHQADHHRLELPTPWWEAAHQMRTTFHQNTTWAWLETRNIWLAGIERPYGPNRQSLASLHTILGAVLASLPNRIHAFQITPADMRRELGLNPNCNKGTLHLEIAAHTQLREPDAMDAWAAAHAAMRINERGTPVPKEAA